MLPALGACGASGPPPSGLHEGPAYAFHVAPGETFDMMRGRAVPDGEIAERLRGVRLLFLGEHHTNPRSHRFQRAVIEALRASGRKVGVALEMFPPSANRALEAWRLGKLDELAFLERAGWYTHWGFPWAHYRELFLAFRRHGLPLRGVNAERDTRLKVRQNKLSELPSKLRGELEGLTTPLQPGQRYLLDTLKAAGHAGEMTPDSPTFKGFSRVQEMWERLMGQRAARWAESRPNPAVTVVLIGSGHLAHRLGANLRAARISRVAQLTVWDTVVDKDDLDAEGRFRVPLGMADWVRVYTREKAPVRYPSLAGLKLKAEEAGVAGFTVERVSLFAPRELKVMKKGDRIVSLNGKRPKSATALRLAYERLPFGKPARFSILRGGEQITLEIVPRAEKKHG
ncbi:MAG: ChaN family lipoprotein [bacterium]